MSVSWKYLYILVTVRWSDPSQSMHDSYDWVLIIRDSTYINPFELESLINKVGWVFPCNKGGSVTDVMEWEDSDGTPSFSIE